MIEMRALIDNRQYFDRIMYYYRMFSYDCSYNGDNILIEPARITRISTQSIAGLLEKLVQYGQQGERSFIIATHGNPNGLPIRIRPNNAATLNSDFMNALGQALSANAATRQAGRDFALSYEANGAAVFGNEQQLDTLLGLIRNVRHLRLERLEFRGCNIGAGSALRALHQLLGAEITAGPTVQFMWARLSTASSRTISAQEFAAQLATLPPDRRTFTRVDCYGGSSPDNDIVVALGITGNNIRLIARDRASIKGWTQAYLQQSTLFALGQEPPGGGYHPGGYLPIVGFLTPNGPYPFVVPGDVFRYTDYLAYEMQPPQWIP
jgi:hypothetical protein